MDTPPVYVTCDIPWYQCDDDEYYLSTVLLYAIYGSDVTTQKTSRLRTVMSHTYAPVMTRTDLSRRATEVCRNIQLLFFSRWISVIWVEMNERWLFIPFRAEIASADIRSKLEKSDDVECKIGRYRSASGTVKRRFVEAFYNEGAQFNSSTELNRFTVMWNVLTVNEFLSI
ncbi:hypothetical protein CBL_11913 [Carabus blaptoides fortunei]